MDVLLGELGFMLDFIGQNFMRIWPYLLITIPISVAVNLIGVSKQINQILNASPIVAIAIATAVGAFSPLCSCTVIPVVAALLIGGVPLAPVMAFWVASPSMDPEIFALSVGMLGWDLALWRLIAALVISFSAGIITHIALEQGWLGTQILRTRQADPLSLTNLARNGWRWFGFGTDRAAEVTAYETVIALQSAAPVPAGSAVPVSMPIQSIGLGSTQMLQAAAEGSCCDSRTTDTIAFDITPTLATAAASDSMAMLMVAAEESCCDSPASNSIALDMIPVQESPKGAMKMLKSAAESSCCETAVAPQLMNLPVVAAPACNDGSCAGDRPLQTADAPAKPEKSFRDRLIQETWDSTSLVIRFMLIAFLLEALIIRYVPQEWIISTLGGQNPFSIPLAAFIGIPVYTSNLAALPLIGGLLEQGMNPGAALAFLIAGPTTTLPAITAVWQLATKRVFGLYVSFSLVGALVFGTVFMLFG